MSCEICGGDAPPFQKNVCSWECRVTQAERAGGKRITPNNLPVTCIGEDGSLLECEGGAHPDYTVPVKIVGEDGEVKMHALIYTDTNVAVTHDGTTYAMWYVKDGSRMIGATIRSERLSDDSVELLQEAANIITQEEEDEPS